MQVIEKVTLRVTERFGTHSTDKLKILPLNGSVQLVTQEANYTNSSGFEILLGVS